MKNNTKSATWLHTEMGTIDMALKRSYGDHNREDVTVRQIRNTDRETDTVYIQHWFYEVIQ